MGVKSPAFASRAAGLRRRTHWPTAAPGARIAHSSQPHATMSPAAVDLVMLSDYLVNDPRMVRGRPARVLPWRAGRGV